MNLTQLRYLRGIAEQGYNISRAAAALHTSQPGISKQIQLLEREIGVALEAEPGQAARQAIGDLRLGFSHQLPIRRPPRPGRRAAVP